MNYAHESGFDTSPGSTAGHETTSPRAEVASIDCETAVRRLWDYLDGGLAAPARAEVAAHLASCAECPPHFAFAITTLDALAAARPDTLTTEELGALRTRIRAALGDVGRT